MSKAYKNLVSGAYSSYAKLLNNLAVTNSPDNLETGLAHLNEIVLKPAAGLTYLYRSYQLIQNFYRLLPPVLMDRSLLEFRWLRRLLAATALLFYFEYPSRSLKSSDL